MEYSGTSTQCFFKTSSSMENIVKQEMETKWIREKQNEKWKKKFKEPQCKSIKNSATMFGDASTTT
jgi:hypothetical protein